MLAAVAAALTALLVAALPRLAQVAVALWVGLAIVALADLAAAYVRRPNVRVSMPKAMHTGEHAALKIDMVPPRPGARVAVDWPAGLSGPLEAPLASETERTELAVTAVRRGTWEIARLWLRCPSPLGLFDLVPVLNAGLSAGVSPDTRSVRSGEITLQVRSALYGIKQNAMIGDGAEFHQLRDFVRGMDPRCIDWKQSARHRTLLAKEMHAERNHNVIVAIDGGRLMGVPVGGLPKLDHAINGALALGWAAMVGGDKVGLYAYDARPRLYLPPQSGRNAFAHLRARTAEVDYSPDESNHTLALTDLKTRTPRRSLIVVFSDFVDTTTAELLVENLDMLARRHLVVFVAVSDDSLAREVESAADSLSSVARAVAAGRALTERQGVLERLTRLGVTVIDAPRGQVGPRLVSAYIEAKLKDRL